MSFDDCFFLFIFLCLVSGWIYFIIEVLRGNVKWGDAPDVDPNSIFDHKSYYHDYPDFSVDKLPSSDLHSSYSFHDEYNILNGRSPGTQ